MEHTALNKWAELQRVESFPCKWWAFRHRSKVLEINGSPSSGEADTSRGKATDYDKGAEALWDLGDQDCEMKVPALMAPETEGPVSLADHAESVASTNSLQFPQRIITQKHSMLFTPFPVLDILGLLQIVLWHPCQHLQNQMYFLGCHPSCSVVFLSPTW